MKLKFYDYDLEAKGYWNYGYRFWLSEQWENEKGKPQSKILITTNNLKEVINKLRELSSHDMKFEFVENESLEHHKSSLLA